jgi:LCP family protein required for cell wall assembly
MKKLTILPFIYILVIVLIAGGTYLAILFNKPLNQGLSLQTNLSTATPGSKTNGSTAINLPSVTPLSNTTVSSSVASPTTPAIANVCGGSGSIMMMVLARDENYWMYPFGVDLIRLLKVDFDQKKISVFALPRDLLVNTPHLTKYQITQSNLGLVYYTVRKAEGDDRAADLKATNAIAQIIYDNFDVAADHYVMVEESVLTDAINTVGGIEVDVPKAIDHEEPGMTLHVAAGLQKMDGITAQTYVRYLVEDTSLSDEWGRFDRQADVINGLVEKLVTPATFVKIPELINEFNKKVITDLTPAQIISMACMAKTIPYDQIKFGEITREQVKIVGGSMVMIDPANTSRLIQDFLK